MNLKVTREFNPAPDARSSIEFNIGRRYKAIDNNITCQTVRPLLFPPFLSLLRLVNICCVFVFLYHFLLLLYHTILVFVKGH